MDFSINTTQIQFTMADPRFPVGGTNPDLEGDPTPDTIAYMTYVKTKNLDPEDEVP